MAWIKIPPEHHPIFRAALPHDPRVTTLNMFGAVCGMVNGNMFGGLFARSAIVRLSEPDQREALALDGAGPFDPMGNGRVMRGTVMLPESVMDEPTVLASWLRRGFDFTVTLPRKVKAQRTSRTKKAPAKQAVTKRSPAKPAATKKSPTKKAAARKSATKKSATRKSATKKSARR